MKISYILEKNDVTGYSAMDEKKAPCKKVLVVDDEPDLRLLLKIVLEKHDYKVLEAEDGEKALDLLAKDKNCEIFCVITDYLMPKMNGLELCEVLRNEARFRHLHGIFLITAHLDKDRFDSARCFDEKFYKPLDFNTLVTKVTVCSSS